jgi:DNA polymerase
MSDPREDLRRWLAQQAEAGHQRVWFEPRPAPEVLQTAAEKQAAASVAAVQPEPVRPAAHVAPPDPDVRARKAEALATLDRTQVSICTKCVLHESRTQTVFGVGNPDANVVFVGEAPGRDEDLKGEPFVGRAGQLLTKILAAIGFERDDVYIANVLKCRPPNNRDPLPDEVGHCEPYLLAQLDIIQPRVICALGKHAAQTLLKTNAALGRLRGTVHDYNGIPMIVTYHPAALLRNSQWKRPTWEDVQKLRALHDELVVAEAGGGSPSAGGHEV